MTESSVTQDRAREYFNQSELYLADNYNIRLRHEIVQDFVGQQRFDSVLDIACGNAEISLPFLNAENHLTLLDVSPGMLDAAANNVSHDLASRVTYHCGDFMQTELEPNAYDLVICTGLLAHIADPEQALRRISILLAPAGFLVLQNTNSAHWVSRLNMAYRRVGAMLVKGKYVYNRVPERRVMETLDRQGLVLRRRVAYVQSWMMFSRLLSSKIKYRLTKNLFGLPVGDRLTRLGNDCIYLFQRER